MLPETRKAVSQEQVFPTKWQTVLFRNYGFIPTARIAKILGCNTRRVKSEAHRLGLMRIKYNPKWSKNGYITLIRNNWYLLPYCQLCELLDMDKSRLDWILQHDDFLSVKLGNFKPSCKSIRYKPLTNGQKKQTEEIAESVSRYLQTYQAEPFAFFDGQKKNGFVLNNEKTGTRIVHGYLSPCGDALIEDSRRYMPDSLLKEYAAVGINGVWLHGVLASLSPYPFDKELSANYEIRRKNLRTLISRCKRYGIKVYLYFNEPRGLAESKLGKFAHLMGRRENGYAALCLEKEETKKYLYNAVKDLLQNVKDLGGIITITMSENLTHCNYIPNTNCPICKNIPPQQSAAKVNNVIYQAIKDSGSKAELIANLWGWSPFMEWTEKQTLEGVELLDKNISVMCVSEYDLEIEKGGTQSKIIDYSISNPGPSEITVKTLKKAKETGHKIYAKIQVNNSWECSAVPYLPVFDLVYDHLQNLTEIDVSDYMLTWTLGGYPSPMLDMVSKYAKAPKEFSLSEWYRKAYGKNGEAVEKAVGQFCKGFREYPFSIDSLYYSPKTLGCANLWSVKTEKKQSTMVCYAFDDYENWIKPYSIEVYLSQYEKLLESWRKGCVELDNIANDEKITELKTFARAAYSHFLSDYLQTKYSYLKRDKSKNKKEIKMILEAERENAKELLSLVYANALVGFEASNHYYYTDRNLIEKILLMDKLLKN